MTMAVSFAIGKKICPDKFYFEPNAITERFPADANLLCATCGCRNDNVRVQLDHVSRRCSKYLVRWRPADLLDNRYRHVETGGIANWETA